MPTILKRVAAHFPVPWQHELKRHYYAWQIRGDRFRTEEREFELLDTFVSAGDWVLDIGANVGHYTARLSRLVGPTGRVLAFEPVPTTFELLAHNVQQLPVPNVTLFNLAATDAAAALGMEVPTVAQGAYLARVTDDKSGLTVLGMPLDCLRLPQPIKLAKIDAEGHELPVLRGMQQMLQRDRPTLIVEVSSRATMEYLLAHHYSMERLPQSPNCIFRPEMCANH